VGPPRAPAGKRALHAAAHQLAWLCRGLLTVAPRAQAKVTHSRSLTFSKRNTPAEAAVGGE
jgi:hypothetical protein